MSKLPPAASISCNSSNKRAKIAAAAPASFRSTLARDARCLTDGALLSKPSSSSSPQSKQQQQQGRQEEDVIMPWIGFGTYKLGKSQSYKATLDAIEQAGYRCIDTAFIYGGETTEKQVGKALHNVLQTKQSLERSELFVITKHWRKYHGYDATLKCLNLSLKRLQLDYVDLYLMHWPGPAWTTMNRKKVELQRHGPWHYAATPQDEMVVTRAETWRAMEDALRAGKVKAIGVSNFTIAHLETLKATATIWPPAVNQVECHALYPQDELLEYCQKEGIVLQAYAALGGQDASKRQWSELLEGGVNLMECKVVQDICTSVGRTPAQVLLRWALQRGCAVTPKTSSPRRMEENSHVFDFVLSEAHMQALHSLEAPGQKGRLCWKMDPLRMLDFD